MIGIDLVLGFPESQEGYVGLLVITEYLTKYPYVKTVKNKSAKEIAPLLWEYITLFGPPKVILSDNGTEFVNSEVDSMLRMVGSEHRVTSAYHPRTNGQTERMNATLVGALRKRAMQLAPRILLLKIRRHYLGMWKLDLFQILSKYTGNFRELY